jgi:K+-transporting ATPase A subunit
MAGRQEPKRPGGESKEYKPLSPLLVAALVLFPIPAVFIVLFGTYAPRTKIVWSVVAVMELLVVAGTLIAALNALSAAVSLL